MTEYQLQQLTGLGARQTLGEPAPPQEEARSSLPGGPGHRSVLLPHKRRGHLHPTSQVSEGQLREVLPFSRRSQ